MKKFALVIGHNPRGKGAYSENLKLSEYNYWKNVCDEINEIDDSIDIYSREAKKYYIEEMKPVVAEINNHNYDLVLELHFNSSDNNQANGCECLIHNGNKITKEISKDFLLALNKEYKIRIRGVIEISNSKVRGGYGICNTKPDYILIEPFFGTNEESKKFEDVKKTAKFLVEFLKSI